MNDKYDDAGILIRPIVKLESEMDIEQLHIRMGEMAAEIERLHSVIDAANAQEHVASIGGVWELRWAGAGPIAPIVEKHGLQIGDKLYASPIPAQQSPAVAVPDDETNFCALKSITDSQVNAVARAFWRRIYAYRNDYGIELPKPLPVEFMAHMATALTWVDKESSPRISEQDAREIASSAVNAYIDDPDTTITWWIENAGRTLLAKLNKPDSVGG